MGLPHYHYLIQRICMPYKYAFWLAVRGSYLSRPWRTCYERWTRNRWRTPLPPSQSTSWFQWDSTGWLEFTRSPDFFPNDSQYFSIITWCISQWTNGMVYSDVEVTTTYYNYIRDMDRYGTIMCNHDRHAGVLTSANISLEIPSSKAFDHPQEVTTTSAARDPTLRSLSNQCLSAIAFPKVNDKSVSINMNQGSGTQQVQGKSSMENTHWCVHLHVSKSC